MFGFFTKQIEVPKSNEKVLVEAVQLWRVTWKSHKTAYRGSSYGDKHTEVEMFTSEKLAQDFYDAIINAHKLLKNRHFDNEVTLTKEE